MTKGVRDLLNSYTVTSDLRLNDLTIRRFNVAKPFDNRISSFCGFVESQCSTQHPELTKIAPHGAL